MSPLAPYAIRWPLLVQPLAIGMTWMCSRGIRAAQTAGRIRARMCSRQTRHLVWCTRRDCSKANRTVLCGRCGGVRSHRRTNQDVAAAVKGNGELQPSLESGSITVWLVRWPILPELAADDVIRCTFSLRSLRRLSFGWHIARLPSHFALIQPRRVDWRTICPERSDSSHSGICADSSPQILHGQESIAVIAHTFHCDMS